MLARSLPGLAPSAKGRVSGTPAAPIPQSVLTSPIIGEARRFDGATAPAGWIKAEGQQLAVSDYRQLATILGHGGSRDASTILLPTLDPGWIIAVAGTYPSSASSLVALHRGAGVKLGVSVDGATVRPAPPILAPPAPAMPKVDDWFPGTAPTPDEIEAARRSAR